MALRVKPLADAALTAVVPMVPRPPGATLEPWRPCLELAIAVQEKNEPEINRLLQNPWTENAPAYANFHALQEAAAHGQAIEALDRGTGEISPKSVRNLTWDLQMTEFNSGNPLPQDIRNGLKR